MDSTTIVQFVSMMADLVVFIFAGYYFYKIRNKEIDLEKKEGKIDTDYHKVLDTALARERKILEDATTQADQIIASAQYVNKTSTEEVNKALQVMIAEIQKKATDEANKFMVEYQAALKQLSSTSLTGFDKTAHELQDDLKNQIREFQDKLLPGMEKELAEYKRVRLEQIERIVKGVVQKSAQEILNKAISLDDHQDLIVQTLEKAKKEGVFD